MAEEKVRSQVEDINRSIYDVKDKVEFSYKAETGLTEEIIREISAKKEEPEWMLEKRLKALVIYTAGLPAVGTGYFRAGYAAHRYLCASEDGHESELGGSPREYP